MRPFFFFVAFMVLLSLYLSTATLLCNERKGFIEEQFVEYTIPSAFLGPLSLEFKGVASDLLLVKFMTFIGARTDQLDRFTREDWDAVSNTLETITDLDPYYWDAYLFAQVFLTWDETHYEDANEMLKKAMRFIPDDYRIPYYIGLNYYKFGKDANKASTYIMKAAGLPGSPYYLANLAARLAAYSSDHDRGIIFLGEMMKQTTDPQIAAQYKMRIQLLEALKYLDHHVDIFRERFQRFPDPLSEMIQTGVMPALPEDPYGGDFFLNEDGRVDTTSKMVRTYKTS